MYFVEIKVIYSLKYWYLPIGGGLIVNSILVSIIISFYVLFPFIFGTVYKIF